jgi:hypothetical protein
LQDDPGVTLALAGAYFYIGRTVLSARTFQRFIECWPDHDEIDYALGMLPRVNSIAKQRIVEAGEKISSLPSAAALVFHFAAVATLRLKPFDKAAENESKRLWEHAEELWAGPGTETRHAQHAKGSRYRRGGRIELSQTTATRQEVVHKSPNADKEGLINWSDSTLRMNKCTH